MPRSLPARFEFGGALVEADPVGNLLRARERGGEIAGIVNLAGRRRIGHRLRLDEVAAAQGIGRDAELARGGIDRALDQIGSFRAAGAAIGVDRHGIGVDRAQANMRGRNVVDAGRHADAEPGNVGRVAGQIGAHIGDDVELQPEDLAPVVERELGGRDIVAAVAVGEEMLGALAHPLHRLAQPLGGDRGQRIFAVGKQLGAEAAADVGRDDAHHLGRNFQHRLGDDVADDVAALAAEGERVAVAVVLGDDAAGVHVIGHQALVDDGDGGGAGGLGEGLPGRMRVAVRGLEGEIARPVGPHQAGARLERGERAHDMRQRLPIDVHRLGGVLRLFQRVGHHEGDRIADVAHLVARQDRIERHRDIDALQHAGRRQRPEPGGIVGGQHQAHPGQRAHAVEIDDAEAGVRMRRAQHHRVQGGRRGEIGDVMALPAQQRVVLLARERLTETELHRRLQPFVQIIPPDAAKPRAGGGGRRNAAPASASPHRRPG